MIRIHHRARLRMLIVVLLGRKDPEATPPTTVKAPLAAAPGGLMLRF